MEHISPTIKELHEKKLVGKRMKMSLAINKTGDLWKSFMPKLKDISNKVNTALLSMQVYESSYFSSFNPNNEFEKWAAIEVSDFGSVPEEMDSFTLVGGLYAVFNYKGLSTDDRIFQYIFMTWLPNSAYQLDSRPHFEILGEKYKNNDPNSEEEIWIPVMEK